jgi:hypothetical protein
MPENENWIFLGDSITEGVGSLRINYVDELVRLLRVRRPQYHYHSMRLRLVDPTNFNRFLQVNVAGNSDFDERNRKSEVCIWNFACEGTTVASDHQWLPLIRTLQPTRTFVLRGALESIARPVPAVHGNWPLWVPASWRGLAALDTRCYFSSTSVRRIKQQVADALKQRVRNHLSRTCGYARLMDIDEFARETRSLLSCVSNISKRVHVLTLPPVSNDTFPTSSAEFHNKNRAMLGVARELGIPDRDVVSLGDAGLQFERDFYRDGFHPNLRGAAKIAETIATTLELEGSPRA